MRQKRPIGIFDSGVGGLTVARPISQIIPGQKIVYFGDTARVPYGTKSKQTIIKFSVENVKFLLQHDVRLVVVACNSSSAAALPVLRKTFRLPIIGVIKPGALSAVRQTKNKRIGVIGTPATIQSGCYSKEIKRMMPEASIFEQVCPLFVPLVEEGWTENKIAHQVARIYIQSLKQASIDTLILGCTHYPLLSKVIGQTLGPKVKLIDSGHEVADQVKRILSEEVEIPLPQVKGDKNDSDIEFYVSDEPEKFRRLGAIFLGRSLGKVRKVKESVSGYY